MRQRPDDGEDSGVQIVLDQDAVVDRRELVVQFGAALIVRTFAPAVTSAARASSVSSSSAASRSSSGRTLPSPAPTINWRISASTSL
ncbi:hypothetical protein [Streptomyces sp. B21-083]|uniref:hypothetical protein n=1 Tax=Streptomyces sp. B21-083 TaxID=3039410 RepID=UPI002FF33F09